MCLSCRFYLDLEVCELLREMDAFTLIVYCCIKYVEKRDKGIVMQVLGIIASVLGVCKKSQNSEYFFIFCCRCFGPLSAIERCYHFIG